jgi:hypothetical protein
MPKIPEVAIGLDETGELYIKVDGVVIATRGPRDGKRTGRRISKVKGRVVERENYHITLRGPDGMLELVPEEDKG